GERGALHLLDAATWQRRAHGVPRRGARRGRRIGHRLRPRQGGPRLLPAAPTPPSTAELVRLRRAELAAFVAEVARDHDVHHAQDCLTASALLDLQERGLIPSVVRTVHHVEAFADPYLAACQERSIRQAALCLTVSRAA